MPVDEKRFETPGIYEGRSKLTWPYVCDSAFASLKSVEAMHDIGGLFMQGIVKTCHSGFPKEYFNRLHEGLNMREPGVRGSYKMLKHNYSIKRDGNNVACDVYGLAWFDKKCKMIISNVGTTAPGNPSLRFRHRKVKDTDDGEYRTVKSTLEIPRPQMVESLFQAFSIIDIHDHFRQGSINMGENVKSLSWWHNFTKEFMAIIYTQAFIAYRYEYKHHMFHSENQMNFTRFLDRLAYEMIHNEQIINLRNRRARDAVLGKPKVLSILIV